LYRLVQISAFPFFQKNRLDSFILIVLLALGGVCALFGVGVQICTVVRGVILCVCLKLRGRRKLNRRLLVDFVCVGPVVRTVEFEHREKKWGRDYGATLL
jgi:hypothetical protein